MSEHRLKSIIKFKDDDMGGWEISFETKSPERLERRKRVDEVAGWNMQAYPKDHPPPHIHCWKDGAHVVVNLDNNLSYRVRSGKPKINDIRRLRARVKGHKDRYIECYHRIVGN